MDSEKLIKGLNTAIETIEAGLDILKKAVIELEAELPSRSLKSSLGNAVRPKQLGKSK